MGFSSGFTGGVALTLTFAYLAVLAHQRTRLDQSHALRRAQIQAQLATSGARNLDGTPLFPSSSISSSTRTLKAPLHDHGATSSLYPSASATTTSNSTPRAGLPTDLDSRLPRPTAVSRRAADLVELAKDRWNAELTGAVRWAQVQRWDEWRRDAESGLGRLAGKAGETLAAVVGAESGATSTTPAAKEAMTKTKKDGEGGVRTWWQR